MTVRKSESFFVAMGVACLLYAVIGFGPGFVEGVRSGLATIPLRIHLHGVVMMGWLGLFILQGCLVWRGNVRIHRAIGRVGAALFLVVFLMMVAFSLNNLVKPVPPPVEILLNRIFAFQFIAILLAPILFALALWSLPDSQSHRRYMLVLTLMLIEAATVRMTFLPGTQGLASNPYLIQLYPSLLLLLLPAFDFLSLGRLHRATVVGAGLLVVGRLIAILLWQSSAWNDAIGLAGEWLAPHWPAWLS